MREAWPTEEHFHAVLALQQAQKDRAAEGAAAAGTLPVLSAASQG